MNTRKMIGEIRERIGNCNVTEVSDRRLTSYIDFACAWASGELGFNIKEDRLSLALTASQAEYPLPSDFLSAIFFEWNGTRLEPVSISERDRDLEAWQNLTAANPTQYAIHGRKVIILPPPSSSAVTTDSIVTYRYIAAADPVGADGPGGLSENDVWLIIFRAVYEFCISNPSDANAARAQGYVGTIQELLQRSRQRWENPSEHLFSGFTVDVGSRVGGAR